MSVDLLFVHDVILSCALVQAFSAVTARAIAIASRVLANELRLELVAKYSLFDDSLLNNGREGIQVICEDFLSEYEGLVQVDKWHLDYHCEEKREDECEAEICKEVHKCVYLASPDASLRVEHSEHHEHLV